MYDNESGQNEIFDDIAQPIIDAVLNGYNGIYILINLNILNNN